MNILKDRLLHFLVLGAALFVTYGYLDRDTDAESLSKTVVVDRDRLLTHVQYRSKAFDDEISNRILDGLSDQEREAMINELIREEVLYREAKALNLDRDDYVIRMRLVQKMEYITRGLLSVGAVSDESIRSYFDANKGNYFVEPHITFTHVYFDRDKHGAAQANQLADEKLQDLNGIPVPFSDAVAHGDRFLYHVNYVEREPDFVANHFGNDMTRILFSLNPDSKHWYGPYESTYGYHLIMISQRGEGRFPELEEIDDRVRDDARRAWIREKTEAVIDELIKNYDIRVVFETDPTNEEQDS